MTLNNKRIIKALSFGVISLGVLVGLGLSTNSSNNTHADALDDELNQGIAETEASDKNFNRDAENGSIQTTLELRNDKNYPIDVVETLNNYPDLEHSAIMNKMISYLSPKGREQFDEYYFNNSATGAGLHLKESSDAAAGLNYDPKNSADNYLPLKGQHYISTSKEKRLQNPPLFSNDDSKAKPKKHAKRVARHAKKARRSRKHNKRVAKVNKKSRKARKHARKNRGHAKKSTKRTKLSKKQLTKLNKQLRKDKKALKSRRAKRSYKYRKALNKTIKQLQKKMFK